MTCTCSYLLHSTRFHENSSEKYKLHLSDMLSLLRTHVASLIFGVTYILYIHISYIYICIIIYIYICVFFLKAGFIDIYELFAAVRDHNTALAVAQRHVVEKKTQRHSALGWWFFSHENYHTVDGSEIRLTNQLRLVVYPTIPLFTGFYTSQVVQDFFHQQYPWLFRG